MARDTQQDDLRPTFSASPLSDSEEVKTANTGDCGASQPCDSLSQCVGEHRSKSRKPSRTEAKRAEARRLAHVWTTWLHYDLGMSQKGIGRALKVGNTPALYLAGGTAPYPRTLERLRALCAEHYPGLLDDARWMQGPERAVKPQQLPLANRDPGAPQTRGDCCDGIRPCPWIGCRQHLLSRLTEKGLPVVDGRTYSTTGGPRRVDWDAVESQVMAALEDAETTGRATCALDVAELGGQTLDEVGRALGVTRERVRQIEGVAMRKVRASGAAEWAE